jgi:hypothetical protein
MRAVKVKIMMTILNTEGVTDNRAKISNLTVTVNLRAFYLFSANTSFMQS